MSVCGGGGEGVPIGNNPKNLLLSFRILNSTMKLYLLVTVALCGTVYGAKNSGNTIEFLYASSLYRSNHLLENVAQISIFDSVQRPSHCLAHCLASKNSCRAFNYSPNGTCILLAESLCANETYELTASEHFHYYDIMTTYDFEVRVPPPKKINNNKTKTTSET